MQVSGKALHAKFRRARETGQLSLAGCGLQELPREVQHLDENVRAGLSRRWGRGRSLARAWVADGQRGEMVAVRGPLEGGREVRGHHAAQWVASDALTAPSQPQRDRCAAHRHVRARDSRRPQARPQRPAERARVHRSAARAQATQRRPVSAAEARAWALWLRLTSCRRCSPTATPSRHCLLPWAPSPPSSSSTLTTATSRRFPPSLRVRIHRTRFARRPSPISHPSPAAYRLHDAGGADRVRKPPA